ncbi:MAG: hypothetical protein LBV71_02475 [Prevotella sp.]|nr:hypothetical protein [Prevotella sp.]
MMDSKELRKGNVVRRLVHLPIGYHTPTLPYTEITEVRSAYVETSMGTDKYNEIAPIPLSTDILSRSGGTKHSDSCIIFDTDNTDIPHIYLLHEADKFYLSSESKGKCSMPIEFLHHFQNLYFDLTGKELKVIL